MMCRWALLCALGLALWPSLAIARDDVKLQYKTITTPHFEVHYFSEREALAKRTAYLCEEAHQVLSPLLAWTPASRTHVVVEDKVDTANGSANVYGRNIIRIYGMPPEPEGVLGYFDDWLRILIYHEYVHILHLDTTLGISPYINAIIGKQLNPNQTMPRWFIEGLAVHYESARTGTGRINSSLYKMWLRAEALYGKFFDLGQITGSPAQWPFGSAAYLYGAYFVRWIADKHGDEFFTQFNRLYGSRLIPYSMNQASKSLIGESFDEMWPQFNASAKATALADYVKVQARGRTPLAQLTREGGGSGYVRRRPGHMAMSYYRDNLHKNATFAQLDYGPKRSPTKIKDYFRVDAPAGAASWDPTGRYLVYSRTMISRDVYRFNDLFAWDSAKDREVRLTRFERAKEPTISPDGKHLAYVRVVDGTMELVERGFDTTGVRGEAKVLVSGKAHAWHDEQHWQQLSTPIYDPSGRYIIFSWWRGDLRQRDLWRYDRSPGLTQEQRLTPLMRDQAMDIDPSFAPDGTLIFSSDRDGIYNVYAMNLDRQETWQVTNDLMGLYSPQLSEDGKWLYATTYGPRGYDIVRVSADQLKRWRAATGEERAIAWKRYPKVDADTWQISDYEPARWSMPLFFVPDLAILSAGTGFGGVIAGTDPIDRHYYQLGFSVAKAAQEADWRPSLSLSYTYGRLPINLSLTASYNEYLNANSRAVNGLASPFPERRFASRVGLSYPILSFDDALTLELGYTVDHRTYAAGQPQDDYDPGAPDPREPELGWFNQLSLGISYNDLERYAYSISTSEGIDVGGNVSVQSPSLGSDYTSLSVSYYARLFKEAPWHDRHVFTVGMVGGFIETTFRGRRTYALGGQTPQNVLESLVFQTPTGGLVVRGYDPYVQSGNQYIWSNAEYRFPIWDLERGFSTVPLFFRQIKGRAFVDMGAAYDGYLADADLLTGVGAEVQLSMLVGYYLAGSLRLGYARGLDSELGRDDLYLLFGGGY